jgi:DNA (cytosine-5)-methyltransferase 1
MTTRSKLNFIDLFSGSGGLSCGMEMAGWNCLLGVDHDRYAMQSFDLNHKKAQSFCGDIRELKTKKLNELLDGQQVHAIVGGPPCQGFSTVGIGDPKDLRNQLFKEFVRIVRQLKPYYLVMENVTGLVAKKNEKTLKAILRYFEKLGYHLDVQVLSAQHYGVPEKRKRTIILGTRLDLPIEFPKKTHDTILAKTYRPAVNVDQAFADLHTKAGKLFNHDIEASSVKNELDKKRIARIPEGCGIRYQKDELAYLPKRLRLDVDWENLPENRFRQTKYQRLDGKSPSPTIMTHRHNYFHPTEDRYLTVREAARLQSFPNDFEFCGPVTAQWRQVGNAVPPLLGKAIGKTLKQMHNKHLKSDGLAKKVRKKKDIDKIRETAFQYRERA